jgi:hypothetical protein
MQPPESTGRLMEVATENLADQPGMYLHGEQEFIYHRQPVVGDVLEGRTRVSEPIVREGRRTMEFTWFETVWRDLDGTPVVTERITSIYLPQGAP